MRKNIERIIGLTLCMGILAGCAQTPESSLVRQKGSKALDSYKEADGKETDDNEVNITERSRSANETTASQSTAISDPAATDAHTGNSSASRTTIRDLINAPGSQ